MMVPVLVRDFLPFVEDFAEHFRIVKEGFVLESVMVCLERRLWLWNLSAKVFILAEKKI